MVITASFFLQDKQLTIPDDLGKDSQTVAALQRRLANFEHDLIMLGAQVRPPYCSNMSGNVL